MLHQININILTTLTTRVSYYVSICNPTLQISIWIKLKINTKNDEILEICGKGKAPQTFQKFHLFFV